MNFQESTDLSLVPYHTAHGLCGGLDFLNIILNLLQKFRGFIELGLSDIKTSQTTKILPFLYAFAE